MIFDEKKAAEEILKNGFSSFMSRKDLGILAKYFKYIGKNKTQIRKSLIDFCEKHNPEFNEVLSRERINNAINGADKFGLRLPVVVSVTESELDAIKNIGNYSRQKILFVMLVVAKYAKYSGTRYKPKRESIYDDNFYINEKTTSILKMAKVNMNKIDRRKVFADFKKLGAIDSTYSGAFQIMIVNELSPISLTITNMDDMISFYPFYCEKCGKIAEKIGKRHNLCLDCYLENSKNLTKNRVKKYRNKSM